MELQINEEAVCIMLQMTSITESPRDTSPSKRQNKYKYTGSDSKANVLAASMEQFFGEPTLVT